MKIKLDSLLDSDGWVHGVIETSEGEMFSYHHGVPHGKWLLVNIYKKTKELKNYDFGQVEGESIVKETN